MFFAIWNARATRSDGALYSPRMRIKAVLMEADAGGYNRLLGGRINVFALKFAEFKRHIVVRTRET